VIVGRAKLGVDHDGKLCLDPANPRLAKRACALLILSKGTGDLAHHRPPETIVVGQTVASRRAADRQSCGRLAETELAKS
jgi:hypothetical protein